MTCVPSRPAEIDAVYSHGSIAEHRAGVADESTRLPTASTLTCCWLDKSAAKYAALAPGTARSIVATAASSDQHFHTVIASTAGRACSRGWSVLTSNIAHRAAAPRTFLPRGRRDWIRTISRGIQGVIWDYQINRLRRIRPRGYPRNPPIWARIWARKIGACRTVNPQVPGSSPGRGARYQALGSDRPSRTSQNFGRCQIFRRLLRISRRISAVASLCGSTAASGHLKQVYTPG